MFFKLYKPTLTAIYIFDFHQKILRYRILNDKVMQKECEKRGTSPHDLKLEGKQLNLSKGSDECWTINIV